MKLQSSNFKRLLAAVGAGATPAGAADLSAAPPATAYDWRDPHFFNAQQRNRLAQALGQATGRMAGVFARLAGRSCEVSLQGLTEHFAGDLCHRWEMDQDCCLAFGPDQAPPCGFVSIAPPTMMAWITWLLGDSGSDREPGRALSPLEESLLSDLLTAVLDAFLASLRGSQSLRAAGPPGRGQPSLQFERTEELARIVFEVRDTGGEPAAVTILVPCRRLAPLAGRLAAEPAKVPPQELTRALAEHLHNLPVVVTAVLASTTLTFREVLELGPGDILLLDKPVDGPAELIVDGRPLLGGRPARSEGRQAVVIAESAGAGATQATGRVGIME